MEIPKKFGKYKISEIVGQGSMGTVFRAEQDVIKRVVAIKVLPVELAREDPRKLERFECEAKSVARLFHPHIVTIFEVGNIELDKEYGRDKIEYFSMQCVEGDSLAFSIESHKLSLMSVLNIFEHIASALDHAHKKDVVHRDIKPSNILVDEDGNGKLLDFGIAKMQESPDITKTGYVIGSAPYMSPEQARGEKVDGRSDIFSLGVVIYEAFTKQRAFHAENKRDMILDRQILHKLPRKALPIPMRRINPEIPNYLEKIVHKCMEGNILNRYQTAGELLEDIERCKLLLLAERKYYNLVPKLYFHRFEKTTIKHIIGSTVFSLVLFAVVLIFF